MNLSDECLLNAFCRTPNSTPDEQYCGAWDNVDLSKDSFPQLTGLNAAKRIRSKFERDGKLLKPLRFTPLFTLKARKAVSTVLTKRERPNPISFENTADENILSSNQTRKKKIEKKNKQTQRLINTLHYFISI